MSFPRHTLAEADALVAAAGFQSTSVDAAERCVDCRRYTRRTIVGGPFYCSAPAHVRRAIEVARVAATHMRERAAALDAMPTEDDEQDARTITTRPVGAGLAEVALGGQAIGRTRLRTAGTVERDDRFDAYTTTGERIGENLTRDDAHALLVHWTTDPETVEDLGEVRPTLPPVAPR